MTTLVHPCEKMPPHDGLRCGTYRHIVANLDDAHMSQDDRVLDHLRLEGIPPSYAGPAGFEQITYGAFVGPYFIKDAKHTRAEFVKMWKTQPRRELPFRFGYPDAEKNHHMMVTRPKK